MKLNFYNAMATKVSDIYNSFPAIHKNGYSLLMHYMYGSGSLLECKTLDGRVAGSRLTGGTVLCS